MSWSRGLLCVLLVGCGGGDRPPQQLPFADTLYVGRDNDVIAFDIASGEQRAGRLVNTGAPRDLAVLDATLYVSPGLLDEVIVAEAETLEEYWRIGVTRPGPGVVTDAHWIALGSDTAVRVSRETRQTDTTFLLGAGAHTGVPLGPDVIITSDADCGSLVVRHDAAGMTLAVLDAATLGFDAPDPGAGEFDDRFCDPSYQRGLFPRPIGCVVAGASVMCAFETGQVASWPAEDGLATAVIETSGTGPGAIALHPDGQTVYVAQAEPRGGCQVGTLSAVRGVDVVGEIPLGHTGPACTSMAPEARPDALHFAGTTLFVALGTTGAAETDQLIIVDATTAAAPVQRASITVGAHSGRASIATLGVSLFVAASVAEEVTVVDIPSLSVAGRIDAGAPARRVAVYAAN